jgi:23S rRNA pseudouridine2605 synthase
MEERLQKLMARAGLGSRRDNEKLIAAGRVTVNGRVATLGQKADPESDHIAVDGRRLKVDGDDIVYI